MCAWLYWPLRRVSTMSARCSCSNALWYGSSSRSCHTLHTFKNTSKHTCSDSLSLKPPAPLCILYRILRRYINTVLLLLLRYYYIIKLYYFIALSEDHKSWRWHLSGGKACNTRANIVSNMMGCNIGRHFWRLSILAHVSQCKYWPECRRLHWCTFNS